MKKIATLNLFLFLCFVLFAQENGGPYTSDENTVLLMHFDGDATNSANVGNHGIIHGSGVSYETGVHGNALRLDNSTSDKQSWIEVPFYDDLNFTDEFSIECWFKINSWGDDHNKLPFILKKGEGWPSDYEILLNKEFLSLSANMNCIDDEFNRGADVRTTDIMEAGKWYHIAIYFNFSHHHFYMVLRDENFNEIYASHRYAYTQASCSNEKLYIGFGGGNDNSFDGFIDELRISNKYLKLRDDVVSAVNTSELKDSVQPLLRDKWKVYQWPFMAYFPISKETGERHKGNSCGMTASMRLVHYWEHPRFPMGDVDYDDGEFHWLADFDNTEYRFDEMPNSFGSNPSEEEYSAAATMVAQIGATEKKYGIGSGGAPIKTILEKYFKFKDDLKIVYREEYTKTEWETIFKNELSNGRPILIEGTAERYDNGNWAGHFYICDGYSADNKFHTDLSIGDIEWWTDIDNFEYGKNQCALIYAEPEWNGKTLELDFPKGGEYLKNQSEIQIKWNSTNIQNVLLEYSTDAGKNWQTIHDDVDASTGKYQWTIPETVSKEYKVRLSDSSDGNIYRRSNTFEVFDKQEIAFEYPINNTYFQAGSNQPLYWSSVGVKAFKLEYSTDDENWILIKDSVVTASGKYELAVPELESETVRLKATNLNDETVFFNSELFKIKNNNLAGGPYGSDENTVLLMHFEKDLSNAANTALQIYESNTLGTYIENYTNHLGKAFQFNNSETTNHAVVVTYNNELNFDGSWTIEMWFKLNSLNAVLINKPSDSGENYNIHVEAPDGHMEARFYDTNGIRYQIGTPSSTIQTNKLYHVTFTNDISLHSLKLTIRNEDFEIIFNETLSYPAGTIPSTGDADLAIGNLVDGYIDELRISNVPASQIATEVLTTSLFADFSCYPNPINTKSIIQFSTEKSQNINLSIFDIQGRKIGTLLDKNLHAGKHTLSLENKIKTSGIYFCKLTTSEGVSTLKLIVNSK